MRLWPWFPLISFPPACTKCHGDGRIHKPIKAGDFAVDALVTCPHCRGIGNGKASTVQ